MGFSTYAVNIVCGEKLFRNRCHDKSRIHGTRLHRKNRLCSQEEKEKIIQTYKDVNKVGIKSYNYVLLMKALIKLLIYAIIMMAMVELL